MPSRSAISLCLLLLSIPMSHLHAAGAVVRVDTIAPGDLTLVLKDFNSNAPEHLSVSANTPTPPPSWVSANNGYHSYEVSTTTIDGKVNFSTVPYDVLYYSNVRVRLRGSTTSGSSDLWPNNPQSATTNNLGNTSLNFTEVNRAWNNPTHPEIKTSTLGGLRWDPNTIASANARYDIDYIMIDRGRVVGFEFDMDELPAPMPSTQVLQNWTNVGGHTDNYMIEGGVLKGVTNHTDSFIQTSSLLNLNTDIYQFVEIRLKTNANVELQFFWATSADTIFDETKSIKVNTTDDQWHTYLVDMSEETTRWEGNLNHFRIDIGRSGALPYEIDYIRFREFGAVPEPARITLLLSALGTLMLRRKRHRGFLPKSICTNQALQ